MRLYAGYHRRYKTDRQIPKLGLQISCVIHPEVSQERVYGGGENAMADHRFIPSRLLLTLSQLSSKYAAGDQSGIT